MIQLAVSPVFQKVYPSLPERSPGQACLVVLRHSSEAKVGDRLVYGVRYATFSSFDDAHHFVMSFISQLGAMWTGPRPDVLDREFMRFKDGTNRGNPGGEGGSADRCPQRQREHC